MRFTAAEDPLLFGISRPRPTIRATMFRLHGLFGLAHDIVAHETTHAILDGMQRRLSTASNPDVLALHEGFADMWP